MAATASKRLDFGALDPHPLEPPEAGGHNSGGVHPFTWGGLGSYLPPVLSWANEGDRQGKSQGGGDTLYPSTHRSPKWQRGRRQGRKRGGIEFEAEDSGSTLKFIRLRYHLWVGERRRRGAKVGGGWLHERNCVEDSRLTEEQANDSR
eukprot:746849-Hanusia_phi.AAC.4